MKIYIDLTINKEEFTPKELSSTMQVVPTQEFAILGIPDSGFCKYSVDKCIKIKDKNIKNIVCNNNFVIDIKILKNKNIIKRNPDEYIITFKKSGNCSLTFFNKNGSSRSFGLFGNLKTSKMKFGNKFEKGEKYEKFWQDNHVDLLYSIFSQETSLNNVTYFVNSSLKKASIPVVIYDNKLKTKELDLKDYKNNLLEIVKNISIFNFNTIFLIEPELFYLKDTEIFLDIYKNISKDFPLIKFGICIELQMFKTRLDCTTKIGQQEGIYLLTQEATLLKDRLKALCIQDDWLLCFNNNRIDSFCKDLTNIHFNNDVFLNYMYFITKSTDGLKNEKMLYNIPVGLINKTDNFKPHTNTRCDYEDGSPVLIFGGKIKTEMEFYKQNLWGDTLLYEKETVEIPPKIDFLINIGIKWLLFGSELPTGTTSNYSVNSVGKCGDKGYLIKKIMEYEESFI